MNRLIIKANGIDNIVYTINFNDPNVKDLIETINNLEQQEITMLLPKDTPPKVEKSFKASMKVLEVLSITTTFGISEVNVYVKGGFTKGESSDSVDYWALRGYLPQVRDEATTDLLTKDVHSMIEQVNKLKKDINEVLDTLSNDGYLVATKSWYDFGFYHHTMRSGKASTGIDGVISYEASEQWQKQLKLHSKNA